MLFLFELLCCYDISLDNFLQSCFYMLSPAIGWGRRIKQNEGARHPLDVASMRETLQDTFVTHLLTSSAEQFW